MAAPASARARLRSVVRGDPADPAWIRPALWAVVALAAALYLWQLDISGYANQYYASAAQAGSQSWSAFFFGALDSSGFITVDKPPAALWLMGLSVRLLGLSSWSILLPQAICGVATVVVLYLAARRSFGPAAGVIAALVLALTPIAVLIFRYDNPDALLALLLVGAAWATVRAIDDGRTRWIVLAAVLVGFAFLTKYLQAYVVLPALLLAFVVAAPGGWRHRAEQLLAAGVALVLASGWWVVAVEAIPAGMRPHIGGTSRDSVLDLLLGYDGLGRIFGATGPGGDRAGEAPAARVEAAGSAARRGPSGCSTTSGAARSPGSSRRRRSRRSPASWRGGARPAPIPRVPASSSGGRGWSCTWPRSASRPGSSTRTTPWSSPRRSARSWAAGSPRGGAPARRTRSPTRSSPRRAWSRPRSRTRCSAARPTSSRSSPRS